MKNSIDNGAQPADIGIRRKKRSHLRQPVVDAVIDNFLMEGELNLERASARTVREICGTVSRSVLNRGADPATDARTTY